MLERILAKWPTEEQYSSKVNIDYDPEQFVSAHGIWKCYSVISLHSLFRLLARAVAALICCSLYTQ